MRLGIGEARARFHLGRDIAEVTHNAVPALRQRNTIDLPGVVFRDAQIETHLSIIGGNERLTGRERVPEQLQGTVRPLAWPQDVHHLVEVASDEICDAGKRRQCRWIHRTHTKARVDQVHTKRRFVEERFELRCALPQRLFSVVARAHIPEKNGDLMVAGLSKWRDRHVEPPPHDVRTVLESLRDSGDGNATIQIVPSLLAARNQHAGELSDRIRHARMALERGIRVDDSMVDGPPVLVKQHLDGTERLVHRVQQRTVPRIL